MFSLLHVRLLRALIKINQSINQSKRSLLCFNRACNRSSAVAEKRR